MKATYKKYLENYNMFYMFSKYRPVIYFVWKVKDFLYLQSIFVQLWN